VIRSSCKSCGDPAQAFDSKGRLVCSECFAELELGVITCCWKSPPPSKPSILEDDSPGWHNTVRAIEDQLTLWP
jgi:hypothetical protein